MLFSPWEKITAPKYIIISAPALGQIEKGNVGIKFSCISWDSPYLGLMRDPWGQNPPHTGNSMVFISNGKLEHGAHMWRKKVLYGNKFKICDCYSFI